MPKHIIEADTSFGKNVVEKALAYVNHEWYATEKNVMHGMDSNGRFVDTPDITWKGEELHCGWWKVNQRNVGVPYSWGNGSTLDEFDAGIKAGKYAGNVPEDKSRKGSWDTVGVDCSGLLTICWNLQKKIVVKEIPEIAQRVEIDEIRQGDIFANRSHVMIFEQFLNEDKSKVQMIDSTRSTGKVSQRSFLVEELIRQEFVIYRKKEGAE